MDYIRGVLAKNLLDLKKANGLSQTDIALAIGVSPTTYNRWETSANWPDTASLEKLATYYGIKSSRFFYDPDLDKTQIANSWIDRPTAKEITQKLEELIDLINK